MLDNIYTPLMDIGEVIKPLINPAFLWVNVDIELLDTEIFNSFDGNIQGSDKIGVILQYTGFKTNTNHKSTDKVCVIHLEYRVVVVAPSELFPTVAGAKWCEIMNALNGFSPNNDCFTLNLIDDLREGNEPDFKAGFCAIPMMFSLKQMI